MSFDSGLCTRRRLLRATAGGVVAGGIGGTLLSGCSDDNSATTLGRQPPPLPATVAGLPARQHAWNSVLKADRYGNRTAPRHQTLLMLTIERRPTAADAQRLEAGLRQLERSYPYGPAGLLTLVGWGTGWFQQIDTESPVPAAIALSETEDPELDRAPVCMHLASDNRRQLTRAAAALLAAAAEAGLSLSERRDGIVGAGLARRAVRELQLPRGVDVPTTSPLMMGFASGMRRNQADEQAITIAAGRWAGGTTMHVSLIGLQLTSWYRNLDLQARIDRMYAPGITARQVDNAGPGIEIQSGHVGSAARRYGVVGHAQTAAAARIDGRARILRRDFNGVDLGRPLNHFVALQRDIEDFIATRRAMNANAATVANPAVGTQINNGINEWLNVHSRANYYVPPRSRRSFPGLPGWDVE